MAAAAATRTRVARARAAIGVMGMIHDGDTLAEMEEFEIWGRRSSLDEAIDVLFELGVTSRGDAASWNASHSPCIHFQQMCNETALAIDAMETRRQQR